MKPAIYLTLTFLAALLLTGFWCLAGSPLPTSGLRSASAAEHDHAGETGHDDHGDHADPRQLDALFDSEPAGHAEHDEHAGHDEHSGHDEQVGHGGHDEHGHAGHSDSVTLQHGEADEFGIRTAQAGPGQLQLHVELPGEIVINADRQAHVVPRVPGIVRDVTKKLGDRVADGELMAVLESRELADAKAEYLAAVERHELAGLNFQREERLWQKKISAEQEYLDARQSLAEAHIALRSAEQKLHILGFSDSYLKQLPGHPDMTYTRYEIRAPFAGVVIQKHITLGEALGNDAEVFVVADLSTVWVDISVYQKDLAAIRPGQTVTLAVGHGVPDVRGTIAYIGPLVGEATRTALARVELPNPEGLLRPGMFVTAEVETASLQVPLVVPKSALQTVEDRTVVFVAAGGTYQPRPVRLGRTNATRVEIVDGLTAGETYVIQGAFTLKAQLTKGAFGDGHNH